MVSAMQSNIQNSSLVGKNFKLSPKSLFLTGLVLTDSLYKSHAVSNFSPIRSNTFATNLNRVLLEADPNKEDATCNAVRASFAGEPNGLSIGTQPLRETLSSLGTLNPVELTDPITGEKKQCYMNGTPMQQVARLMEQFVKANGTTEAVKSLVPMLKEVVGDNFSKEDIQSLLTTTLAAVQDSKVLETFKNVTKDLITDLSQDKDFVGSTTTLVKSFTKDLLSDPEIHKAVGKLTEAILGNATGTIQKNLFLGVLNIVLTSILLFAILNNTPVLRDLVGRALPLKIVGRFVGEEITKFVDLMRKAYLNPEVPLMETNTAPVVVADVNPQAVNGNGTDNLVDAMENGNARGA